MVRRSGPVSCESSSLRLRCSRSLGDGRGATTAATSGREALVTTSISSLLTIWRVTSPRPCTMQKSVAPRAAEQQSSTMQRRRHWRPSHFLRSSPILYTAPLTRVSLRGTSLHSMVLAGLARFDLIVEITLLAFLPPLRLSAERNELCLGEIIEARWAFECSALVGVTGAYAADGTGTGMGSTRWPGWNELAYELTSASEREVDPVMLLSMSWVELRAADAPGRKDEAFEALAKKLWAPWYALAAPKGSSALPPAALLRLCSSVSSNILLRSKSGAPPRMDSERPERPME
mmetsp:Transcript_10988/g.34977  ORF Transcript_10988/g.34977 Transcript_10988/m.34977 type:complete len:290 (+) Transcript_10988:413-1282(+)